mmetsp:Transcript_21079/g.34848  ORF Transcript_21079/g.34848 Transcript_21079/m.34848 type:complete len:219 (-) Transcript_21079:1279-1935(-)
MDSTSVESGPSLNTSGVLSPSPPWAAVARPVLAWMFLNTSSQSTSSCSLPSASSPCPGACASSPTNSVATFSLLSFCCATKLTRGTLAAPLTVPSAAAVASVETAAGSMVAMGSDSSERGRSGGGTNQGSLPLCQSFKIMRAHVFISGSPFFKSRPLWFANCVKKSSESDHCSILYVRVMYSFFTRLSTSPMWSIVSLTFSTRTTPLRIESVFESPTS